MTDRELLELAAKAARLPELRGAGSQHHCYYVLDEQPTKWNPLTDDGDALRLAVKLDLWLPLKIKYFDEPDKCAATRRGIVRAAAEIGKGME